MANNNFEYRALGAYKQTLFKEICTKETLSDLLIDILMPILDDDRFDKIDNFVGNMPDGDKYRNANGETEIVKLHGRLFDVPFIYTTITGMDNVICMDTEIAKNSHATKEMLITIMIMCHKDGLLLDSATKKRYKSYGYIGKNRLDIATAIVGDILNHSDIKAIGKLEPIPHNPVRSYFPNDKYMGKILTYISTDFMIDYAEESIGGDS